ncbi:MAG: two-component system response regulator, partial [Pseudomonadota bacterium]
ARIVAIVDVYDALRSRRPYKESWPEEASCNELQRLSGHQLDPHLVGKFLHLAGDGELNRIRQAHSH